MTLTPESRSWADQMAAAHAEFEAAVEAWARYGEANGHVADARYRALWAEACRLEGVYKALREA